MIHVSYVPVLGVVGEQKTKPTQHSVQVLRSLGLHPNMLCCRAEEPLADGVRNKLAMFCQVRVRPAMFCQVRVRLAMLVGPRRGWLSASVCARFRLVGAPALSCWWGRLQRRHGQ